MSKFHFHLRHKGEFIRDWDGIDMPSLGAAKEHARLLAGQLWRVAGVGAQHCSLEISDDMGQLLEVIHIRDSVRITPFWI